MPIRDKVYNKLKSLGLTDSKEDFFNYYDNDENVRKDVYRRLREDGLRNSEDEFYAAMKPQKVTQQPEDDAVFEANAERFRNGQPIERVTTQSVIDANPELGSQQPVITPYSIERASLKEQVASNSRKFPKMGDLPWAKPQGGTDGYVHTTDLSERLNRTYQDGGMESFLHSEEDEKIKAQYTPKEEKTTADVWGNAMNKFALTERGGQLQSELAQIQDEITNKYLEEFKDSDEYKQFLGKKYATKDEEYKANKAVNDLFNAKYAEAISNDMQPYMQAYNNEVMHRYGVDVESGLNNIAKKEAAETLWNLSTSVNADLEKIEDAITSRQKAVRNTDWKPGMPSSRDDAKLSELRGQRTYLEGAKELIEDSQNILNAVEAEKDGSFFGGLGRGIRDKAFDIDTWTMGLSDLVGGLRLKSVLEKAEKGETLTPAEEKLLDASVNNMAVNFFYRNDLGLGYQAGEITGQSIPFMLEFLVNPVSASGNAMAKRLLTYGLKRFGSAVNSKAIKAGTRLATDALASGGVTATTGMGHVLSGGVERLNRNYEYGLDEEGNLNVVNTHNMGVGEAFAKSATSAFLERQSEMIFNAFRGAPSLFKGIETSLPGGVNTFMNYVSNSRLGELWRGIKNNATMNELAKRTQFHGLGEEYLEEVYNNFANIPLGEMTFEEATDLENNIVTFLGLAPTQVMFSAIGGIGYGVERYKARRDLERTFGKMTEEQKRKLIELQEMGKLSTNKDIAFFLAETIKDESLTPEQKRAEIEYAYNLAKQNAIDEVSNTDVEDSIESENHQIDAATDPQTGMYGEVNLVGKDLDGNDIVSTANVFGEKEVNGELYLLVLPEGETEKKWVRPNEYDANSYQKRPAEEVKAINEEMIREEAAQQAEQEAKYAPEVINAQMQQGVPFDTPNAQIVPVAPMPEGNGWIVEEYALDTNNKVAKTPIVRELTNDEYRDMLQAQLNAEEAAQEQIAAEGQAAAPEVVEEVQPTEEADVKENFTTETGNNLSPVEEVAQPQAEVKPQTPVIPAKEDGSIDFVSYGKEGTFKTLGEKYGEKMPNKVAVTAKALAEDLKKAQNKLQKAEEAYDNAPIGREQKAEEARDKAKQELEAIQREANFWAEMDAEIKDAQARRESMLNPQAEVETSTEPMNVDEFVAQQLASGNIVLDKEDYKKETGYGDTEANAMNGGTTKLFGNNGMTIQEAGERLMEIDRENGTNFFDQLDSNSGRDALINVLGSVKSRKELNQYIATNRAEQAKRESEGLRNELEKQAMEANYASLEDYVLQMEVEEMENPFLNDRADEIMAIFAEEAAKYEQSLNNTENGQGTENEVVEGNDSILPEEQLDNTGGTEVSEESERIGDGTSEESESTHAATEVELKQEEGETTLQFAERAAEENRRRPLRKRAEEWSNTLGIKVTYLESIDDVDAKTRAQIEAAHAKGESVPGWVNKKGEVFFFMPDLRDLKDVDDTYIHEVVAHVGLPQLLGKERFGELCDKVWEMMPQSAKDYYMSYPGVKNHRDAADEYIAHLAEQQNLTPEEKTIWDNIVKMFREMLDKALNGIISKSKLTDEDISNLIKASYANLKSGAEGNVSGESTKFRAKWRKGQLDKASRTIRRWLENNTRGKSFELELPKATLDKVRKAMGRDFESHNITSNGIVHALKNHGENGLKLTGISIPLSKEDVELIPYIMTSPDRVEKASTDASGRESVRFYKDLSNGYVVVVEKEYKNSPDDMETITMWAELSSKATNAQQNAAPDTHVRNAILSIDIAKIRKDAEDAIEEDENLKEKTSFRVVKDKNGNKSLVGLHNISEAKLKKAIKQGGLANPSMAVIDMDKQSHVDYGDITLVAPSSLVDKKTGKNIGTYTADAWTPIYPQVEKQMSKPGAKEYSKDLEQVPSELRSKVRLYFNAYLEDGNTSGALNYWFLHDTGKNPPLLTSQSNDYTNEELDAIEAISNAGYYSGLNEEEKQKVLELFIEKQGGKDVFEKNIADRIETMKKNLQRPDIKSFIKKKVEQTLQGIEEYGYDYEQVSNFYANAQRAINNRGKIDEFRTFRNAQDIVNNEGLQGEFDKWLSEKEEQFGVEEYIFVGYNNNGDRKYIPNTLENASRIMKKEGRAGATGLYGFNHFVATLAPNAGSLVQIRKKKGNLSSQEEYKEFVDKWGSVYHDLAEVLRGDYDGYSDVGYYRLEEMPTVKNPKEYVKKEYGIDLSDEFMQKYNDFVSAIKNDFPARYFETKFERPVYLNEFAAAVVPQGTSKDVVDALTEAGLPVEKYESGNNEARMAAVDKVSSEIGGIRFRFIGERGARNLDKAEEATTRLDNLAVAREMETAEKDAKTIKMATGWERGADGLWRYEVDDNIDFELRRPKKTELKKAYEEANEKYYKLEMRVPTRTPKNATEEEKQRIKELRKELAKLRKGMNKAFDAYYDYSAESATLGEFLGKDNQLFKEYPELADYDVSFLRDSKKLAEGLKGSFTPEYKVIWVDDARPKGDIKSTLVHEIQHAIQGIEGFAQGGTPTSFASAKYQAEEWKANFNEFINRYGFEDWSKNLPIEDWMKYGKEYKGKFGGLHRAFIDNAVEDEDVKKTLTKELDYVKAAYDKFYQIAGGMDPAYKFKDANEWYRSLSGEVESRNVQQRMGMTDEQRRNSLASETEDVAREDQIFLKDGNESGMRFRLSEKGKQIQAEVDKFTSKYNSKPVRIVEAEMDDNELMKTLDYAFELEDVKSFMKESKTAAGYFHNLDKIIIFADKTKVERMEEYLFHENIHAAIHHNNFANLVAHFYEYAKNEAVFEKWSKLAHNKEYKQYNSSEEFLAYVVSNAMVARNLDEVAEYLGEKQKKALNKLFNVIGYNYDIRRRSDEQSVNGRTSEETSGESSLEGNELLNTGEGRGTGEGIGKGKSGKVSAAERKARLNELFNKVADMGLQGVLGNKEYTSLMVDIYKALPEGVRAEIAEDALRLYGGSVAPAVSDYIGPKSKNSIMDKVVTIVREALRKIGFDLDLNANEVRYMAWRSKKPLDRNNLVEVAEDIDMRFRLKVGEYDDSPTPDGGGTRFSVKSKPKTKAELKEEVRDLKEDVKSLKDEVRDLKKQVNTLRSGNKDEWEKKQRAIVSFIKGRLTKEAGSVLGKTRLDQLLTLVNKASTATDLHKPLQFIEQVINDASIEHAASKMDKLIKTKLQGETNRGVAKGVVVDETTRRLFDSIRGTFKDLIVTSIDSELRSVRGEILRFGKEINALPEDDVQGRAILTARQDALKERRKELEKEQEELQRHNVTETKESLERRHDELVEAMDAHIEGEGVWTQEMQDEYDSIPLRLKLAEIRESQSQLDAILADAIMTRRNAYKNNGETRKKMLAEADVIESNYTIAQEELIRLMNEVSDELNAIIKEGKSRLAKRKQALAERRIAIVTMGISAVKDKKIKDHNAILSRKEKFDKWFDNSWLKSVSDFMTAPLNSFNFMLKYIDRNHTIGEGELYNHFMKSEEGALEANNRLYDGLKAYNTAIEEKAKEIFGKDIESVMKDSGKEYTDKVYKQYMYDSSSHKEGEMYPISITKGQALYVWLTWRQDDGRAKLVADGWNDQSIEEIEALIGEDYIKFGEWITDEFFPMLREEKYNKTHIDMFGTSMAKREHYFPFKVQSEDIQEKGEMGESYSGMPSTITGNIIKRTINKSRIKTDQNAFDLLYKYGNDMETWNAMAKLRQDLNFLHSSKAFRNYLEANSKGLFDKFMKAAEVAVKAYNNGEKDAINDFFAKLNRTWAGTNIGFRLNTAMKQILSYPAFMAYSGNLKYQGYLMKYMLNWVGNYKWAKENLPAFSNRVESGDMGMTGMTDPSFDLGKVINKFGEWGMIPNQLVDALTCAAGARSVYDFEYNRAIKAGMSEEEAKNIAQYNAEVAFNETQQSSRDEFVSPTQVSRNVLIKSMMNYQNSNVGYQRLGNEGLLEIMRAKHVYEQDIKNGMSEDEAKKKVVNSVIRGTRKMMIAFTILPGLWYLGGRGIVGITAPLISSLFGGGDDDEPYLDDEAKEDLMLSMALGIIAGTTGGQAIASVVQGREYEPMAYVKEFTKIIADAVKDGLNLNTTKNIALKMAKFGGVNVETFENIYIGVEHAIRTGNFDLVDFMFLINLPPSQRKKMAEELYSDMPFMEYAEKVARAQKLFDDYRKNLPYAKGDKNGSKKNAIKKQYVIENLSDDKQDKLEKEKEFKKLQREYNSEEDKAEWLEDHPEYTELEKNFKEQEVTKEVNRKAKELK